MTPSLLAEAFRPIRTPSTSTAVPKAALPARLPPPRRDSWLSAVRSGLMVFPPANKAAVSDTPVICRWSRAFRPRVRVVPAASSDLLAVTTTSSRAREFTRRTKSSLSRLTDTVSFSLWDT